MGKIPTCAFKMWQTTKSIRAQGGTQRRSLGDYRLRFIECFEHYLVVFLAKFYRPFVLAQTRSFRPIFIVSQ